MSSGTPGHSAVILVLPRAIGRLGRAALFGAFALANNACSHGSIDRDFVKTASSNRLSATPVAITPEIISVQLPSPDGPWDTPVGIGVAHDPSCRLFISDYGTGGAFAFDVAGGFAGRVYAPERKRIGRTWVGGVAGGPGPALLIPDYSTGTVYRTLGRIAVIDSMRLPQLSDSGSPVHELRRSDGGVLADHWFSTVIPLWAGNWVDQRRSPIVILSDSGAVVDRIGALLPSPGAYLPHTMNRGQIAWDGDTLWYGRFSDGVALGFRYPDADRIGRVRRDTPLAPDVEVRPPLRFVPTTPYERYVRGSRRPGIFASLQLTAFTAGEGLLVFAGPRYGGLPEEAYRNGSEVLIVVRSTGRMYSFQTPTMVYSMGVLAGSLWMLGRTPWTMAGSPVARAALPQELQQSSRCRSQTGGR